MAYYIDLSTISLEKFKGVLKTGDLIPSWMILRDDIDRRFELIKQNKIKDMQGLQEALKTNKKVEEFSQQSGLPEDYLAVLRRVINGYHPKPNNFKDFPNISAEVLKKLEAIGIKNTVRLYEEVLTTQQRSEFSQKSGIALNEIEKLARYSDISRIRWVNHTFAYVLYEAGYNSTKKIANSNPAQLYTDIKNLNEKRKIYNAHIGENDMKLVIESAKTLEIDVNYE